jgi:phosphoenolpyruvate phosphomutase
MIRADAKRKKLRDGLHGSAAVVAVGTHDAMSARLAESYGFDAIWVSGFGVSTMTYAIPDLNLITMTEALAAAVRMDAATNLPVVADCDNGFGGLSNVVRTIVEYERAGIAGICIEDNAFPKRNSLLEGAANRALISINEQSRRIRAAKEAQETNNVVLIARVEALIAGYGVEDACRRADAYAEAGADAILIHSRDRTLSEIEAFLGKWQGLGKVPLVAVPTLFPMFTVEQLHEKGFQMVILANQLMRASVKAMEDTLETLKKLRNAAALEGQIASVNHIFELVKTEGTIEFEETPDQDVSTPDAAASPGLASRGNRVQPTNTFIEFKEEEIEQSIAERFERMVGEHAARVAVKTRTERVTYSDLNRWANQVARAILANRGWGEEPVAVVMEAGPSFLAAILGVLKTGRFYVPLDPSYPVVRIGYILNDSTAGLLLTNDQN